MFARLVREFGENRSAVKGRTIHGKIITFGVGSDVCTNNHLLSMYLKFQRMDDAQNVFDAMRERNLISWTALISGYSQMGMGKEALRCFKSMVNDGFDPNHYTYAAAISACTSIGDARAGKEIHGKIFRTELELITRVGNCLINMYGKSGLLNSAQLVFDAIFGPDSVSWTSLLSCYCKHGKDMEALKVFLRSREVSVMVNEFSCASVLGACASLEILKVGMQIHSLIFKCGIELDNYIVTALINLYAKCGNTISAHQVFSEVNQPQVQSWTALIGGYAQQGKGAEAINLFNKFHSSGLQPNERSFSSVLGAFSDAKDIEVGKQLHSLVIKMGFDSFIFVGHARSDQYGEAVKILKDMLFKGVRTKSSHLFYNLEYFCALLDMYAKCGRLSDAKKTFDNLISKNVVSWNTMLMAYAHHGLGSEALDIFSKMQKSGVKPNDITFLGVLSACGHVGLVEEGWCYFNSMIRDHRITPGTDHLASVVSLFARKGQTRRAYEFIRTFTKEPDKVVWRCLLSGCITQKDFSLGIYAAEKILDIDPEDASAHIMLSSICAEAKMWDVASQVRKIMKDKALRKETGYSWTELKNKIYYFSSRYECDTTFLWQCNE
ncbi:Pentatricopeptide repeat-containing protein [Quillaja saponaria]|uniref:Pentatricopeptide repeat-containing protein n=1 Tax=Quillaja saponaria TaxID=32244 RepID=A0AAD7Q4W3_QUISA|nr:Pentatricopeptide repeat-containing protein [Quillaja saponaria]